MKNIIALVLVVAVIVASQLYLHEQQKIQISVLASQQAGERQQDHAQLSELTQKLEAVQNSVVLMKTEYASAREAQFEALRDKLDDALTTQNNASLQNLRNEVDDIINNGALFQDHTLLAEEALALAEKAKTSGDTKLAAIYYLSAINHAPSEYRFLQAYSDLVMATTDPQTEDIAQLRSVLQVSTYQVPPARIAELLSLLGEAEDREAAVLARQAPTPQSVDWKSQLDDLNTTKTIEESWADSEHIAGLVDTLADTVGSLREEQPDSELLHRAENELDLSRLVLRATLLASTLDTLMANLVASMNQPEKAVSLLQTAEATLGQLWGVDQTGLPMALSNKMDGYPITIKKLSDDFSRIESVRPIANIADLLEQADELSKANFEWIGVPTNPPKNQRKIEEIKTLAEEIFNQSKLITSVKGRKIVELALKRVQKNLADVQRRQFDAYQKWAIGQTAIAFKSYDETNFVTSANDKVWWILKNTKLADIDQALLTSETGNAFRDVLGKLIDKVDGETAFEIQKHLAEGNKKALTDF